MLGGAVGTQDNSLEIIHHRPNIWEVKNAFLDSHEIINSIPIQEWQSYTNDGGVYNDKGSGNTIIGRCSHIGKESSQYTPVYEKFKELISRFAESNNILISSDNLDSGPFVIREYQPGSSMAAHQDAYGYIKKDGQFAKPVVTALLYLNDNYIGGEINFPNENIKIKPDTGSMVVFSSNLDHGVLEIIEGNRYLTSIYAYENSYASYLTETSEK
jgi:hypothetical protein